MLVIQVSLVQSEKCSILAYHRQVLYVGHIYTCSSVSIEAFCIKLKQDLFFYW